MKKRGEGDSGITVSSLIGLIIGLLIFVPFLLYGCKVFNESQLAGKSLKDFKEFIGGLKDGESGYISIFLEKDETLIAFNKVDILRFSSLRYDRKLSDERFKKDLENWVKNGEEISDTLNFNTFKRVDSCEFGKICLCACNKIKIPKDYAVEGEFSCNEDKKNVECESITKPIFVMGIGIESFNEPFIYKNAGEKEYYTFFAERVGNTVYVCEEKPCYLKFECSDYNGGACLNKEDCYVSVDGKCASCLSDKYLGCTIYGEESCISNFCNIEPGCTYNKELGEERGECIPTSPGFVEY